MKIGILGYGKEGQSAEKYFTLKGHEVGVIDNFTPTDLEHMNLGDFDLILRSPSVHPRPGLSSMTQYFFQHCPCPIIGVTGTKGKGTTCSLITDLLKSLQQDVYLVGNIGTPSIEILDQLTPSSIVVYELSSFQLWDLSNSPHIAVILGIEPDHLNVHDNYNDYINAKANISRHQTASDTCIYYYKNPDSTQIAQYSAGHKISYPVVDRQDLDNILSHLSIPGQHNRDNAEAALLTVASYYHLSLHEFLNQYRDIIIFTLEHFQGLPHRLQFLRERNHVKYYDDNFSTNPASLAVAVQAFPEQKVVLIAGGRDKTANQDLPEISQIMQSPNLAHIILMGESGHELYKILHDHMPDKLSLVESLSDAVTLATTTAEKLVYHPASSDNSNAIVLMSPAAASFDMFENVYARGAAFQKLIQDLA